jgi:hypothetical protein
MVEALAGEMVEMVRRSRWRWWRRALCGTEARGPTIRRGGARGRDARPAMGDDGEEKEACSEEVNREKKESVWWIFCPSSVPRSMASSSGHVTATPARSVQRDTELAAKICGAEPC